ncbi:MAG TPA: hypothetical protein VGJ01_12835 [Pseudolabrys sp.]|jgi:hypothetical protein
MPSGLKIASDSIAFKSIDTGGQKVGNGGDGHNYGDISNSPSIKFDPYNNADGAKLHVNTGDHVYQKADWDAGGANGGSALLGKANGGYAESNGDQSSQSGYDTSTVHAPTNAYQTNFLLADQHQSAAAGIGGDGGSFDSAYGGHVNVHADDLLSI